MLRPSLVPGMLAMIAGNLQSRRERCAAVRTGHGLQRHHGQSGRTPRAGVRRCRHRAGAERAPSCARHRVPRPEGRSRAGAGALPVETRSTSIAFPPEAGLTPAWLHPYRAARVVVDGLTVRLVRPACIRARPRRANSKTLCSSANSISTGSTSCRCESRWRARSRASSRCAAIFLWFWTRALAGRASTRRIAGLNIPELVEWRAREVFRDVKLGCARVFAAAGQSRSRRRTAPCAKRNCRAFRRAWLRRLAKLVRGCALDVAQGTQALYWHGRRRFFDVRITLGGPRSCEHNQDQIQARIRTTPAVNPISPPANRAPWP